MDRFPFLYLPHENAKTIHSLAHETRDFGISGSPHPRFRDFWISSHLYSSASALPLWEGIVCSLKGLLLSLDLLDVSY